MPWANDVGQLGDRDGGSNKFSATPVDVDRLTSGVASVSAGAVHTCALTTACGVECREHNSSGQQGDGTTPSRLAPVDVMGLESGVAAVSAGNEHTWTLTDAGSLKCRGVNDAYQLGNGASGPGPVHGVPGSTC